MTAVLVALLHVGSPDVIVEAPAGPYRLLVAIRPPQVVPGVAEIDVRAPDGDVDAVEMVPIPLEGEGAAHPPTADRGIRDATDPKLFGGRLWLMRAGSWQVRITTHGARGDGTLSVPVPALPQRMRGMERGLQAALVTLGLLLALGIASIVGASAREGQLEPGVEPGKRERRRGHIFTGGTAAVVIGALVFGNWWWNAEAADYAAYVYKPLALDARIDGDHLALQLEDPGWLRMRKLTDLVPDHGHLMHLFVVRMPEMDRMWHLHPEHVGPARFTQALPAMRPGHYRLYADVVHHSGLAETAVAELEVTIGGIGVPLSGDDAAGEAPFARDIKWQPVPLRARALTLLRFDTPGELEPYMGMMGHAAILARDGSVFAHVHPTGSVPMAVMALANPSADPHAAHAHGGTSAVTFPYAFPKPGDYRVFVQIKRAGRIETGAADLHVD